jgi:hypothetical protein
MTARSKIIESSLSCLDWGMASLIPVLGIFFVPVALTRFRFTVVETNDRWNPARVHLYAGATLAVLSLLAHGLVGVFVFFKLLRAAGDV